MHAQSFAHMSLPIARFMPMVALEAAICMYHVPGKNCILLVAKLDGAL